MFNMFWIYFGYVKKLFIFCEMPFYAKLHIYIIALNILSKINSVVNLNVPDVEEQKLEDFVDAALPLSITSGTGGIRQGGTEVAPLPNIF